VPRSGPNEQYQPIVLPGQIPAAEHSLPGGPRHKRTAARWCPSNVGYLRTVPAMDPMLDPRSPLICRQECCGLGYITASLGSETSKIFGNHVLWSNEAINPPPSEYRKQDRWNGRDYPCGSHHPSSTARPCQPARRSAVQLRESIMAFLHSLASWSFFLVSRLQGRKRCG
jgi:hypothetical protein